MNASKGNDDHGLLLPRECLQGGKRLRGILVNNADEILLAGRPHVRDKAAAIAARSL
jgi:hypothetical protein